MKTLSLRLIFVLSVALAGCSGRPAADQSTDEATDEKIDQAKTPPANTATVFFSVTSDPEQQPQSVDMAMKLAGFSLDEGRKVVIFFNVKGVAIPLKSFADDFAFQDDAPIKAQLASLIERCADVHVCPICMKASGVEESHLMDGAKVTTRPSLFANIGSDTAVFTY